MFTLLPDSEKKSILKEYKNRRAIIICVFIFLSSIMASVSLFPSYLLSAIKTKEIRNQLNELRKSAILQEAKILNETLVNTNKKLDLLRVGTSTVYVKDIIDGVQKSKSGQAIRISGVLYRRDSAKNQLSLSITGVARDRESLSFFVKELEKNFEQVNLPVSNFAREKNAQFTIEIRDAI